MNDAGTTMSNHVEGTTTTKQTNGAENSTQTNSSSVSTNGVSSAGADYSTTHTYHSVKGQTTEAGSDLQNGSSTVSSYSRDEYQIKVNDKPDSDLDSLKDRERFKSEDIVSALQGSTLLDNLVTDFEKGSTSTSIKGRGMVKHSPLSYGQAIYYLHEMKTFFSKLLYLELIIYCDNIYQMM